MPTLIKRYKTFDQFWRYIVTGLVNVVIDYSVLLFLSSITGITSGNAIIPLNVVSFSLATTNSYFMNKYWSFADQSLGHGQKFMMFMLISIIGLVINTTIVRFISTEISRPIIFDPTAWLIAAKLTASAITIIWNFTGYKLIVFRK